MSIKTASLLETGDYSDLIIQCGDKKWNLHRAIVCLDSEFLKELCKDTNPAVMRWSDPLEKWIFRSQEESRVYNPEWQLNSGPDQLVMHKTCQSPKDFLLQVSSQGNVSPFLGAMIHAFYHHKYDVPPTNLSVLEFHAHVYRVASLFDSSHVKQIASDAFKKTFQAHARWSTNKMVFVIYKTPHVGLESIREIFADVFAEEYLQDSSLLGLLLHEYGDNFCSQVLSAIHPKIAQGNQKCHCKECKGTFPLQLSLSEDLTLGSKMGLEQQYCRVCGKKGTLEEVQSTDLVDGSATPSTFCGDLPILVTET